MTDPASPSFPLDPNVPRTSAADRARMMENLVFGRIFSDHMVTLSWTADRGWFGGRVGRREALMLDPAANVLHYGQAVFDGYKAYHQPDGGVATFRPDAHARRFARSSQRLAMPELPEHLFIEAADALIRADAEWIPTLTEQSYYLRPLMIGTEAALGVRPANEYLFILFGSPSGAYFSGGVRPVSVWMTSEYVRAAPGGTGAAKCAGNYAASLLAQKLAKDKGCDQVLWLDSAEHRYIEEMGGMNVYFVFQDGGRKVLATPGLDSGTLLPGITRDSLIQLGRDAGYSVEERKITVAEVTEGVASGRLAEAFACGTAAVITPIGSLQSTDGVWPINGGEMGPIATQLRARLLGIQHGTEPDPYGWMHRVL